MRTKKSKQGAFHRLFKGILALTVLASLPLSVSAADILFVTTGGQRESVNLLNILYAQGHNVTVHDTAVDGDVSAAATYVGSYDLLMLDEVIGSGSVGNRWRNSPLPVINWEGFLYRGDRSAFVADDGTGGSDREFGEDVSYGQHNGTAAINILLPDHPLAAGLPAGEVNIFAVDPETGETDGTVTFSGGSTFIEGAIRVANVPGHEDRFAVFGVDAGTPTFDGPAPARWVHLPWNTAEEVRVIIEPSFFLYEAAIAWALGLPEPTKIYDLVPQNGVFINIEGQSLSFSVDKTTHGGSPVQASGVEVFINGVDASANVTLADGGSQWNVTFAGLEPNKIYSIVVRATADDGGTSARTAELDTFDENTFLVEAENFNFEGGQFFDNIVFCNNFGGGDNCYFDRVSVVGVDAFDTDGSADNNADDLDDIFRFGPGQEREEEVDTTVASDFLRSQYADAPEGANGPIRDYGIERISSGDWLNYTRTVPDGSFGAYLRCKASDDQTVQLSRITSNASQANQSEEVIGVFVIRPGGFRTVALTDAATGAAKEFQAGGLQTYRLTALNGGGNLVMNYFLFTSFEAVEVPTFDTSVTLTSPDDGSTVIVGESVTLQANATGPSGTASSVSQVEFLDSGVSLGVVTSAPFELTVTLGLGEHTLIALATGSDNSTAESSVTFTVNPVPEGPDGPGGQGHGATVIWINQVESEAGQEYQELLKANGYNVVERTFTDPTGEEQNELNDAALVVVSRKVNSGDYNNQTWDDFVSSPLILMSAYLSRSSRWQWFGGTGRSEFVPASIIADSPDHAVFDGLDVATGSTGPWHVAVDRNTSVAQEPVANGGVAIASAAEGGLVVAEWPAGTVSVGHRLLFLSGAREPSGGSTETSGSYDLTATGETAFLNAVDYMIYGSTTTRIEGDSIVEFDWAQSDPDSSTGSGTVKTTVNGIDFSAPMPIPTVNQKDTTDQTIPEGRGIVGFGIAVDSVQPGSVNGFHLGWFGTVTLFGTIADADDSNTATSVAGQTNRYSYVVRLSFEEGDTYAYSADVFDDPAGIDVTGGKHRFAGWVGDDTEGHRQSGTNNQDYAAGPDAFTTSAGGGLGENGYGDNVGLTLALRNGTGIGAVFVSNVTFSGTLQEDGATVIAPPVTSAPSLSISVDGGNIVVTWTGGVLEVAATVDGPYSDAGATSPLVWAPTDLQQMQFVRVRGN